MSRTADALPGERLVALVVASLDDLAGVAEASSIAGRLTVDQLRSDLDAIAAHIVLSSFPGSPVALDPNLAEVLIRAVQPADIQSPISSNTALRVAAVIRALSNRGTPELAVPLIERAVEVLGGEISPEPPVAAIWLTGGLALQLLHQYREAFGLFGRAAATNNADYIRYLALGYLALGFALSGDLPRVQTPAEAALALIGKHGWPAHQNRIPIFAALVLMNVGLLRLDEARRSLVALNEVLESAEPQWRFAALEVQVQFWCLAGEAEVVVGHLEQALLGFELATASLAVRAQISYSTALVELFLGHPGASIAATSPFADLPAHQLCFETLRAFGYLAFGMPREALVAIESCVALGHSHSKSSAPNIPLIRAASAHLLGDREGARHRFGEWMSATESAGYASAALLPSSLLAGLLESGDSSPLPDSVKRLTEQSPNGLDAVFVSLGTLTSAERSLLTQLRTPGTLDDIASNTFTSRNTVKSHLRSISSKLGVSSRAEAVDVAEVAGWFALAEGRP
ncbi:helix-turn-helix transcriptional regulator [Subtercola sp. YIM 133946]|uniref:helix-turn-helix transcriptional regulator n=1 Tax=Subtercola sp. YIM 133946 TaxID=3118909 RepID=UPI002F92AA51